MAKRQKKTTAQPVMATPETENVPFVLREESPEYRVGGVESSVSPAPELVLKDESKGIFFYRGNCLDLLDRIADKHPEGWFDMIFADPPYFLSNGGITCHAGKMVKVDKGEWDRAKGRPCA